MRNLSIKIVGKIILFICIALVILAVLGYFALRKIWTNILTAPMAPENYVMEVTTGGEIEARYMATGEHETAYLETDYSENSDIKKIEIWYPAKLETSSKKYPVVLFVNGTGVSASRYKPVFEHLASWGFIAIGNEDPSTWEGKKADATLTWLLTANKDESSVFIIKLIQKISASPDILRAGLECLAPLTTQSTRMSINAPLACLPHRKIRQER